MAPSTPNPRMRIVNPRMMYPMMSPVIAKPLPVYFAGCVLVCFKPMCPRITAAMIPRNPIPAARKSVPAIPEIIAHSAGWFTCAP